MAKTKPLPPPPKAPAQSLQNCVIAFAAPRLPSEVLNNMSLTQAREEITNRGGSTTTSIKKDAGCTHLVVKENQFERQTGNISAAISNDEIHIVNFKWLEAAFLADKHVDEGPFLLYDRSTATKNNVSSTSQSTPPSKPVKSAKRGRSKVDNDDDGLSEKKKKVKVVNDDEEMQKNGEKVKSGSLTIPLDDGLSSQRYHVHVSDDSMIYDVTLSQTNSDNNNNKFYRIQLLQSKMDGSFFCWTRWGRVGERGQSKMLGDGSWDYAIKEFNSKFKSKHGNSWEDRLKPQKKPGYTYIERNYEDSDEEADEDKGATKRGAVKKEDEEDEIVESKLPEAVQDLMKLIFNQDYFESTFASLNYDAQKMPLGKLSKRTLLRGYEVLKELAVLSAQPGAVEDLKDRSNAYFSLIPHAFGRGRPPVLDKMADIKREIELLETLTDMQLATDIMKDAKGGKNKKVEELHILDRQYAGLKMQEVTPLDEESVEFGELATYLKKSGGHTHALNYSIQDIFRIERQGEHARFDDSKFAKIQNTDRRLLWHGSRCTNFGGILSQGLRIAPPEAPVSGYMFGKGVYLADMSSKSANYCCSHNSDGVALLLLCEAELGKPPLKLTNADYNAEEHAVKAGSISTWGVGQTAPLGWKDAGCVHESLRGVLMPDVATKSPGPTNEHNAWLQYNEFIVYDVAQIKLRYLLRVRIN